MNNTPPTLQEELDRKTLEAMENALRGQQQGRIAPAELHTALQAIWDTTAGLVREDISHLVAAMLNHVKEGIVIKRLFVNVNLSILQVEHDLTASIVLVKVSPDHHTQAWGKVNTHSFDDKVNPGASAQKCFTRIVGALPARGWVEVK